MKTEFNNIPIRYNDRKGHPITSQYNFGDVSIGFYNEEWGDIGSSEDCLVCIWYIHGQKPIS